MRRCTIWPRLTGAMSAVMPRPRLGRRVTAMPTITSTLPFAMRFLASVHSSSTCTAPWRPPPRPSWPPNRSLRVASHSRCHLEWDATLSDRFGGQDGRGGGLHGAVHVELEWTDAKNRIAKGNVDVIVGIAVTRLPSLGRGITALIAPVNLGQIVHLR